MAANIGDDVALKRTPATPYRRGWIPAVEFVLGEPATRFELVHERLVSFFDLLRLPREDDAPPLALAIAKLTAFIAAGVAITTLVAVFLGTVTAKAVTGFVG